jgi:uncharacterized protein YkwD
MTKPMLKRDGILTGVVLTTFFCLFILAQASQDKPKDLVLDSQESLQTAALQAAIPSSAKIVPPLHSTKATEIETTLTTTETEIKNTSLLASNGKEVIEDPTTSAVEKTTPKESVTVTPLAPPLQAAPDTVHYSEELRQRIIEATNKFRQANKVSSLAYDATLQNNAQKYSATLLAGNFLSHTSKQGCDMSCRFKNDNFNARAWGENLAVLKFDSLPDSDEVAAYFMREWAKSAGHRDNLLSQLFTHQGIGVAIGEHAIYVTVQFADPL